MVTPDKNKESCSRSKLPTTTINPANYHSLCQFTSSFPVMAAAREKDTELLCCPGIRLNPPPPPPLLPPSGPTTREEGVWLPELAEDPPKLLSPKLVNVMLPGDIVCCPVESISILTSAAIADSAGSCCR